MAALLEKTQRIPTLRDGHRSEERQSFGICTVSSRIDPATHMASPTLDSSDEKQKKPNSHVHTAQEGYSDHNNSGSIIFNLQIFFAVCRYP